MKLTANIDNLIPVLKAAGDVIMDVYNNQDMDVVHKSDDSPLTQADTASDKLIVDYLKKHFDYPVISEEGEHTDYELRKNFESFWLVDPLDGTKEFINRNGEFTVNIALVKNGVPVLGGIYVPVQDLYYLADESAAYKKSGEGALERIHVARREQDLIAVGSKSHAQEGEQAFYDRIGVASSTGVGSSLKFCLIAEGKADVYYRSGPTMEWDTAAGQAIVSAAGGNVYKDLEAKELFSYNKENLKNGAFLCVSNPKLVQ